MPNRVARRPRRDAARNRERLLIAAEAYFGERSIDAPLQGLAKAAGLGEATLFRHFPSHEALVRALYDRIVDRVDVVVSRAVEVEDPWLGIEAFMHGAVDIQLESPAVPEIMRRQAINDPDYRPGAKWVLPLRELVKRAVDAGELRPDFTAADLATSTQLISGLARIPGASLDPTARRQLQVLLDGMRASAASAELPSSALNTDGVHRLLHEVVSQRDQR